MRTDVYSAPDTPESSPESNSRIWVTVTVVVGSILLVAAFVTAVLVFFRRRGYREAKKHNPALSQKEFLRKMKMSAVARQEEDELQRRMMIRKSLASRSTGWSTHFDNDSLNIHEHEQHSLREDWKEWEARMQRERPEVAYKHPSAAALAELPVSTQSRPQSPSP